MSRFVDLEAPSVELQRDLLGLVRELDGQRVHAVHRAKGVLQGLRAPIDALAEHVQLLSKCLHSALNFLKALMWTLDGV